MIYCIEFMTGGIYLMTNDVAKSLGVFTGTKTCLNGSSLKCHVILDGVFATSTLIGDQYFCTAERV